MNEHGLAHICNYCYSSTVGRFLELGEDAWLNIMVSNYPSTTDYELVQGEINSWKDTRKVLVGVLKDKPEMKDMGLVFEYVVPRGRPGTNAYLQGGERRVDALLISQNTVLAMEFKQASMGDGFLIRNGTYQAKLNHRVFHDFHKNAVGMRKRSVLVLTHSQNLLQNIRRHQVRMCSPDMLPEVLDTTFDNTNGMESTNNWLDSEFLPDPRHPEVITVG